MNSKEQRVYDDAFQAAGEEGLEEEACKEAADAAVFEYQYAEQNRVLAKMRAATGGTFAQVRAYWIGGDCEGGFAAYAKSLEADGYSGYQGGGTYVDNREWFERKGITREDYEILVAASL